MTDEDDDREQGIEFGDVNDALEGIDYPVTNEEIVEEFGERTLGTPEGEVTVRETLGPQSDTTYESPDEVRDAMLNMVGGQAVGRQGYTDREPTYEETTEENQDAESF